jgi:UDP-GlcNAc:undecaprenyl-phosphate/decaprenyl-phosphate GlcNAc-1-phosphate transferase
MAVIFYAGITSFLVSLALIPSIIRFSKKRNLFDTPGKRRIHKRITPSFGGIAIFAGFTLSCLIWLDFSQLSPKYFLVLVLIIPFIIGLIDDAAHLKPIAKIVAQVVTALLIFFVLDVRITSTFGLLPVGEFPIAVSLIATVVAIILLTNSFNLIDGIDGLAAFFSITALSAFGVWFFLAHDYLNAFFCVTFVGGIIAFLFQNWEPSRIFMGDTGSLVVGTMLAYASIEFLNDNQQLTFDASWKFMPAIGAVTCNLIVPIVDTTRIVLIRLSKRISPLRADKNHIHHALVRLGLSHRQAVSLLGLIHLLFLVIAVAGRSWSDVLLISVITVAALILCIILNYALLAKTR